MYSHQDGRGCGGVAIECEYYVDAKNALYDACPDLSKMGSCRQCTGCPLKRPKQKVSELSSAELKQVTGGVKNTEDKREFGIKIGEFAKDDYNEESYPYK